ncbi:peptidylprolyl isomerase [Flavobacterium sp. GT3R68]|uniref:peptidylprolyl isomerase n=1 Tax=Flavobacterium sp. GT3R68 TaxID=2594437 RepID=UPI000F8862F7|nr:peptidylprolyl isomerase [Flavobacterium sp. GT3R68]RTY88547.1 peptidylprolyl isomerase [Flavobacterium sp. GSN2]TRW90580.1 peptidylprolyl isomerase [Flavobacterium sp. GT3R68]
MKIKQLFFGLLLSLNLIAYSQTSPKEVLFTIDNKPYYTDEFIRVYNKNLDLVKDESQKDLNQYLDLFIGYKLKINKAYKLGLQNGSSYQNELKSYRTQLSKNYTSDSKVTKELVEEGYNRSLKEIKAAHILILVDEFAAPEDTLKAYRQALDLRQRALKGEDFGKLAVEFSQDPSAKENKGDLGYFSSFRMVYPFETAAYKTPKGSISNPVRTRFGYHLIKVEDVRDNRGEVSVAHIMILTPTTTTDGKTDLDKPKNTIQEIYKKLKQGEKFEDLAKQFSEDKSSSTKGGVLNRFGSGQLSSEEFEAVAFALTPEHPISEPFQSQFGWHIVKLIEKYPVKTLEEMTADLETKVSKDDRSRLIIASMTEKLRKKYTVKRDDKFYAAVSKLVTNDFYEGKWDVPTNMKDYNKKLFTINEKEIMAPAFLSFVRAQQKINNTLKPINKLVDNLYQKYVDEQLNVYYNDNLENEFPEFSAVIDEYRDGLLLFDLMEKEIWEKSKRDSIGLKNFYDSRIKNYNWKNRLDVVIASSTSMDVIKKAQKLLKQNKTPEFIKEKLNIKGGTVNVMTKVGVFEEESEVLPKKLKMQTGVSEIIKEGEYYFVTKVNKILPAGSKTLEESRGKVINDYQQYLEENWVKDLKTEFKVEVNQAAFEKVKKQLKS